ncbi:three component ABC system middle component [Archangium gephyra]|uniref:three component ABC system middle component n=1 Tax=Archangium gephyra TaxID=48 RepID=UPI003B813CA7
MKLKDVSVDAFASLNPALGAVVLWQTCSGYIDVSKRGPPFPLLPVCIPLVLHQPFGLALNKLSMSMPFFAWIDASPEVVSEFPQIMASYLPVHRASLLFGLAAGALVIGNDGAVRSVNEGLLRKPGTWAKSESELRRLLQRARRLGEMLAAAGAPALILSKLRVAP